MRPLTRALTAVGVILGSLGMVESAAHGAAPEAGSAVTVADVTVSEGGPGTTRLATFSLQTAAGAGRKVTVATANVTATAGKDYVAVAATQISFDLAGRATVSVTVNGDTSPEAHETFKLVLSNPIGVTLPSRAPIGTITDDDPRRVTVTGGSVVEDATTIPFTLTLNQPAFGNESVTVSTAAGTATAADFVAVTNKVVTFAAGATAATVEVTVKEDSVTELDEQFTLNLGAAVNLTKVNTSATGTIITDDGGAVISIGDITVTESDSNFAANFTLTLDRPSPGGVGFRFTTSNLTATAPGDYTARNLLLSFPAGATSMTATLTIIGDNIAEATEDFKVTLSDLSGLLPGDVEAIATIVDDDSGPALPTITSISEPTVTENDSQVVSMNFVFTINAPLAVQTSLPAAFTGTATRNLDYSTPSATLVFPAGQTTATLTVNVFGDVVAEPAETVIVTVTDAVGEVSGTGTILDDGDGGGGGIRITSISNPTIVEGNSGTKALNFIVALSGPATGTESFKVSTANGTATAGSDYVARTNATITIPAGNTQRSVTVTIKGDTLDEPNETLLLNIVSAIGLAIDDNQATGTITDND